MVNEEKIDILIDVLEELSNNIVELTIVVEKMNVLVEFDNNGFGEHNVG